MERRKRPITFYRNGDPQFRGFTATVSPDSFSSLEQLLLWLSDKIETTAGCRFLFRLADGKRVKEIDELLPDQAYVVSSVRRLITDCAYGQNSQRFWYNRRKADEHEQTSRVRLPPRVAEPVAISNEPRRRRSDPSRPSEQLRMSETYTLATNGSGGARLAPRQPRVLTVISNTHRSSWRRVLINPASTQSFEDMVYSFSEMVLFSYPPCRSMYTSQPPFVKVSFVLLSIFVTLRT